MSHDTSENLTDLGIDVGQISNAVNTFSYRWACLQLQCDPWPFLWSECVLSSFVFFHLNL